MKVGGCDVLSSDDGAQPEDGLGCHQKTADFYLHHTVSLHTESKECYIS